MARPEPRVAEVTRQLLEYLLSGQVQVGERIPSERQLASALGVGRSAIREAMKPLQLMGLIEARVGDGTYLNEVDAALLPKVIEWGLHLKKSTTLELIEARGYLEVILAGLAADRRTEDNITRMQKALAMMGDGGGNEDLGALWKEFQSEMEASAGNAVMAGFLASVESLRDAGIRRVTENQNGGPQLYAEYLRVFEAIKARDRGAAEAAMAAHVERVTRLLYVTLGIPVTSVGPVRVPALDLGTKRQGSGGRSSSKGR